MNQQQLIEENINLVYHIVHTYYPDFITDEDIVQCGMLGLCKAAKRWDESKATFATFACKCILYEIYKEFKRRKRHKGCLSLDYPMKGTDEETDVFGDLIAGDKDVDYVNLQSFYDTLNPREQEIFDLFYMGLSSTEVAEKLKVSRVTACSYARRLRTLWRNYYGD